LFKPSEKQQAYFDWVKGSKGNCVLEAVAGSGKTTTIVKGLDYMSGYVFLGAYNKKMADELKERVKGKTGVFAGTFHSAGFSALRYAHGNINIEVTANKVRDIAKGIAAKNRSDLEELIGAVCSIVSMAKQRGIGALSPMGDSSAWLEMIEFFSLDESIPADVDLLKVVSYARCVLHRSNLDVSTVDFDDMVYLPLQRNIKMLQNDWVLVDEAQDTNPTRRELARRMLKPSGRLVAVGDRYQAIYGFSGVDNDALEQIETQFNCTKLPLTVTYRCPKKIVSYAQNWVPHIEAGEDSPEGEVLRMESGDLLTALTGTPRADFSETAVLCRYNKHLVELFFSLVRAGIPCHIEGKDIGLGLIKLASKWRASKLNVIKNRLEQYCKREVAKAVKEGKDQRADHITDQVSTLLVLIDRAMGEGVTDIEGLKKMVGSVFSETKSDAKKDVITLSSCHRSKGLEWNTVYLLGREELMPSAFIRQEWQLQQEINLIYVAITRAKKTLIEVALETQ